MKSRNYSITYRILHWAIAICFLMLLFTIFLRSTWLNKHNVAAIIQNFMADNNQTLTDEQSIQLAKKIRKPMWDWHIYIGYALVGLYAIRLLVPFLGQMKFTNPMSREFTFKEKFQYWSYIVFYVCVSVSLTTGLLMMFGPQNLAGPAENIHVLSIYYLLAFIVIHLFGVFGAELTTQRGLISKIISGGKK
ncbi:cytochrome b/b6 domain-containing protein [Flavobacterium sp. TMP13]|uniref:cytochrome b/b6 domain-containing protein n=1 Tax=unclassified Flavobacterium TaxID=196869 RepID=UPI00076C828F|nr:cytochrome b/b6 domain-containing protein [Flavobacterium sp. TAB 87]KVV15168.1 cytochrome b [Flavobacterium sp. TAB 87]